MKPGFDSTCFLLMVAAVMTIWLTSCSREPKPAAMAPGNAVAMVGDHAIMREDLESELTRRTVMSRGGTKEAQALLEEMIRFEVLYQRALRTGYAQDPQIKVALKRMVVTKFQEDQLAKFGLPEVNPHEITNYYFNNLHRFSTPEKIRAALIEFKSPRSATVEKRAEVAARAQAVLMEARTNPTTDHTFGLVAQRNSDHQPSRYRGGDIGWMTVGATNTEWPATVLEALFKLTQPGEIGPIIETPTAFYLVKITERQAASVRSFPEVRDGIAYSLRREQEQQQQERIYGEAKQGLSISINQVLLKSIAAPPEATPPALPGVAKAQPRRSP